MYPTLDIFEGLCAEYTCIPVYKEILADRETPVSVLQRFAQDENVFLLESMEGGETWGRYSFIGVDPSPLLNASHSNGQTGELESLRDIYTGTRVAPIEGLPRFFGGAVGFMGYESIGEFEHMPDPKSVEGAHKPQSKFVKVDQVIVFDNVRHTIKIVVCTHPNPETSPEDCYQAAAENIARLENILAEPPLDIPAPNEPNVDFESNMSPETFRKMVASAKDYIYSGDVIQVVLSQRFSTHADIHPFHLYRALRLLNPSPYTFFLKLGIHTLVGSSPEVMVRLTDKKVVVRPIAGTRPRGKNHAEDLELEHDLLADEKERAEHVMLVDLGRNDVGRIAKPGTVDVTEFMVIERYSHVMHIVSLVEGELRDDKDAYDVVAATFPAGTLSGAPKIRAMQIIHELEPEPRGAYGGAVGYFSYDGNMDLAITIRTLDVRDNRISIQAGAGIVYDSDPQTEFEETCHKSMGMQKAVKLAGSNFDLSQQEGKD